MKKKGNSKKDFKTLFLHKVSGTLKGTISSNSINNNRPRRNKLSSC